MIGISSENGYTLILPGIRIKTLCHGDSMLMSEFIMERGASLPPHSHPYEQTGYLVKGKIRLTIGDESRDLFPGDSWSIPSGITHHADIIDDSVAIEVFHPVREDYLQYLQ